ncbi:MAG: GIN domain-containing protein [Alphaproteobacteria bacterium]
MNDQKKSLLLGAAVATLLILPAAAAEDWVTWPQRNFAGNVLKVDDFVGTLIVNVTNGGNINVDVSGTRDRVKRLEVHSYGGGVIIEGQNDESVWDWHKWFNYDYTKGKPDQLVVKVSVPKGSEVRIDDIVGKATVGDTYGPLHFEASATQAKIGRVSSANISLAGTGRIDITEVKGPLDLDIAGSGKVNVGPTQMVKADIAGAGDTALGPIAGGLKVDIAGSGDISAARVNGPVHVDIAGSGSVNIGDGLANPLHVDIMGSGNFTFGGVAVDPKVSSFGSGSVKIKAYKGKMSSDGMASVEVGNPEMPMTPSVPRPPKPPRPPHFGGSQYDDNDTDDDRDDDSDR